MIQPDGIKLINNVISQFEKTKEQLKKGIDLCTMKCDNISARMIKLDEEYKSNELARKQASNVIKNIDLLLSVEDDDETDLTEDKEKDEAKKL